MTVSTKTLNSTIPGLEPFDFAQAQFDLYKDGPDILGDSFITEYISSTTPELIADDRSTVAMSLHPGLSVSDLFAPGVIQDIYTNYYRKICAQIAKRSLMRQANSTIDGEILCPENRLLARTLSVRIMEASLVVMTFFSLALIYLLPRQVVLPCDPSTISGCALVLSQTAQLG